MRSVRAAYDTTILSHYTPKRSVSLTALSERVLYYKLAGSARKRSFKRIAGPKLRYQNKLSENAPACSLISFPFLYPPRNRGHDRLQSQQGYSRTNDPSRAACAKVARSFARSQRTMGGGRPYRAVTLGQDFPSPAQHLSPGGSLRMRVEGCAHQRGTTIRTETRKYSILA